MDWHDEGKAVPHVEHGNHENHQDELYPASEEMTGEESNLLATVAAVGVVGVGVVVFEAALLPGVVLGVAAMAAPKLLPRLGSALNPLFKSTVRGVYKIGQKTREMVAETHEQVQDIVAEVDAEGRLGPTANGPAQAPRA
jgi:hypothetical protein